MGGDGLTKTEQMQHADALWMQAIALTQSIERIAKDATDSRQRKAGRLWGVAIRREWRRHDASRLAWLEWMREFEEVQP